MRRHFFVAALLSLVGCARQIEGSYVDPDGTAAFRLVNGKYYGTSVAANEARPARVAGHASVPIPLPYKVDGARLIVEKRQGNDVLDILPDGTLQRHGAGVRYIRASN